MDCKFCKSSRILFYSDKVDVRLPYERKSRDVEIIEKVDSHVYCLTHRKVVDARSDDYCEYELSVFDKYNY